MAVNHYPALELTCGIHGAVGLRLDRSFRVPVLSLPKGLHFRNLDLIWDRGVDISPSTKLVEGCCSTLESLKIAVVQFGMLVWCLRPHQ